MSFTPFYFRAFLNARGFHAGAHVHGSVDVVPSLWDDPGARQVEAHLTIADCGRSATLDFDVRSADEAVNALRKARVLQRAVNELVSALGLAIDELGLTSGTAGAGTAD